MHKILFFLLMFSLLWAGDTLEKRIRKARAKVYPALVHIQPIKELLKYGEPLKVRVTGSGFIFRPDGYVLTNYHVAEKAKFLLCTLSSKKEVEAEVVGLDPWTDLAVLKLKLKEAGLKKVPYAPLGDSDRLKVGQIVLALGSPLGLARSLSMGVVSAVDRYFKDTDNMVSPYNLWIQTDAAINPGNSGGPLVDLDGKVIGINSRAITSGENLGFAIPINTAKYVIDQLLTKGEVQRSWIGVQWQEIKEYRKYLGKPNLEGVLAADVEKNSPAEHAGLKPGFLVTDINGKKVTAVYKEELPKIRLLISQLSVGQKVTMRALDSELHEHRITLTTQKKGKFNGNEFYCAEWGFSVEEITPRIMRNFKLKDNKGVLVFGIRLGGPAYEAGVDNGSVLIRIDDQPITGLSDFKKRYKQIYKSDGKEHLLVLKITEDIQRFALIKGEKSQ